MTLAHRVYTHTRGLLGKGQWARNEFDVVGGLRLLYFYSGVSEASDVLKAVFQCMQNLVSA